MLVLILFFGLRFNGFSLINGVSWLENRSGLRFGEFGIAYSHLPPDEFRCAPEASCPLTVELALKPRSTNDGRFRIIMIIHGGADADQLVIGQWRSALIIMNGDDYDGKAGTPKIGLRNAFSRQRGRWVAISSDRDGTSVYIDGEKAGSSRKLTLRIPNGENGAQLVIGNSVYGRHSWEGDIFGIALFDTVLTRSDIENHFSRWSDRNDFSFLRRENPKRLWVLDPQPGIQTADQADGDPHLEIPRKMRVLKKEILALPFQTNQVNLPFFQDIIINLVGFMPIGFFMYATLLSRGEGMERHGFGLTVSVCFLLSIFIEVVQAWIPSRSSELLDLTMNTMGAAAGALFYRYSREWWTSREIC
ncbi:MAG: VanZ family protein [Desulfobacterales bacterium]